MSVKKGDKVRFLNDVGGGKVTRVVGKMVYVEDEDGFEIPALINDVVLIEEKKEKPQKEKDNKGKSYEYSETKAKDEDSKCFLGLLKGDKKGSSSGSFRLFLVNDSNYFISYSILMRLNSLVEPMYSGTIEPNTKEQLDVVPIQFVDNKTLIVQMLFFKKGKSFKVISPVEREINLKSTQLIKPGSFQFNDYFNEDAKLFPMLKSAIESKIEELKKMEGEERGSQSGEQTPVKSKLKSPKIKSDLIEVDLHANQLLDDTRGLSNSDILKYQVDKFHEVMNDNQKSKGQKIVFIHGVGNGVLKNELLRLLKSRYKGTYFQDASFQEYGYGATMVII